MGGKAAVILVLGFTCLMAYALLNLSTAGTRSVGNMSTYNGMTASHNLALAGANVALARLYRDTTWGSSGTASFTQSFSGFPFTGSFTVTAFLVPQGKPCAPSPPIRRGDNVPGHDGSRLSSATNNTFSLFAWMTNLENGVFWITGDSVWGRVHSNDNLTVSGSPVFLPKVTTAKGFIPPLGKSQTIGGMNYTNKAIFLNPPAAGDRRRRVNLPTDMSGIAATASSSANGQKYTTDIWMTLDGRSPHRRGRGGIHTADENGTDQGLRAALRSEFQRRHHVHRGRQRPGNARRKPDDRLVQHADGADKQRRRPGRHHSTSKNPARDEQRHAGACANNNVIVADNIPGATNREIDGEHIRPPGIVYRAELLHPPASTASSASSGLSCRIPAAQSGRSTVRQRSRAVSTSGTSMTTGSQTRTSAHPTTRGSSGERTRSRSGGRATIS